MTAAIGLVVGRSADAVDLDPPASPSFLLSSRANPEQRSVTPYPPLNLVHRPLPESERLVLQGHCLS